MKKVTEQINLEQEDKTKQIIEQISIEQEDETEQNGIKGISWSLILGVISLVLFFMCLPSPLLLGGIGSSLAEKENNKAGFYLNMIAFLLAAIRLLFILIGLILLTIPAIQEWLDLFLKTVLET